MRSKTKSIKVLYFAIMKDERGVEAETIETNANTALALYLELQEKHRLTIDANSLVVAINDEMSTWQDILNPNDIVAFLPPVAGG